jgi:4-oxalocrotonate tautomerase
MPFVRIDLIRGRPETEIAAISQSVHQAMVECLNVPARDRFQIISEHAPERLLFNPGYLGIGRSAGIVLVQVFLSSGRSTQQKQAFYARAAALMAETAGVRAEDVTLSLVENAREDWSFGLGRAQYLELPREAWR